jgi:hypothetical protein
MSFMIPPPAGLVAGSWIPVIEGTTAAGVGTYSSQTGTFIKIGRLMYVSCVLGWSAHTGTGNMIISGLPKASNGAAGVPSFEHTSMTVANPPLLGRASGTTIILESQASGSPAVALPIDTAGGIRVSMSYVVAN